MDGSGVILSDGSYSLTFKLYNAASGGSALWTETKSVSVQDGVFATQLGSTTPITLPFTESYYLGVAVATGSELTPRFPLSSVPYSFMSLNVPDGSITAAKISNGEVVKSLNGLKDAVTLVAGSNVTITPNGNNLTISSAGGGGAGISGSGTTGYIPMFTGATSIENSAVYQFNGNIGIGTSTPGAKLEIAGDAKINILTVGLGGGSITTNSAFGFNALYHNATGIENCALGNESMFNNTTGNYNVSLGSWALYGNNIGNQNTAIGFEALFFNKNSANTATGYHALFSNSSGYLNTANGAQSLNTNNSGNYNSGFGTYSLLNNTSGSQNTAIGFNTLFANSTATGNTAVGFRSLEDNTTGYSNTATGNNSLFNTTTGWQNTSVGANSMLATTTGSYNTALGYNTGPNGAALYNTTCLGIDATATGNNMVRIGNTFVTSIGGQVGWSTLSDGRFKENVNEDVPGLSFITQLRPVTYQINKDQFNQFTKVYEKSADKEENGIQTSQRIQSTSPPVRKTGFIAQEVEQIANNLGYDFSGIDKPENSNDYYGLRYAEFVVPLVKAVQEQQKIIEELTRRIEALEGRGDNEKF